MKRFNFLTFREMKRRERERLDFRRGAIAAIDRRYFSDLPPIVSETELQDSPAIRNAFDATMKCQMAINLPFPGYQEYPNGDQYTAAARVCAAVVTLGILLLWATSTYQG